jgi:lambda repressor-like predicted transcriptional regulator
MHPFDITAALRKAGSSTVKVALATGLSRPYVSLVIHSRVRKEPIEREVSRATGISLAELWPDWYGAKEPACSELTTVRIKHTGPEVG